MFLNRRRLVFFLFSGSDIKIDSFECFYRKRDLWTLSVDFILSLVFVCLFLGGRLKLIIGAVRSFEIDSFECFDIEDDFCFFFSGSDINIDSFECFDWESDSLILSVNFVFFPVFACLFLGIIFKLIIVAVSSNEIDSFECFEIEEDFCVFLIFQK